MINYCTGGSMSSFTSCILNYFPMALNQRLIQNGGQLLKFVFWVGLAKGGLLGAESLWRSFGAVSG